MPISTRSMVQRQQKTTEVPATVKSRTRNVRPATTKTVERKKPNVPQNNKPKNKNDKKAPKRNVRNEKQEDELGPSASKRAKVKAKEDKGVVLIQDKNPESAPTVSKSSKQEKNSDPKENPTKLRRGAATIINHMNPLAHDIDNVSTMFKNFMNALSDEEINKISAKTKADPATPAKPFAPPIVTPAQEKQLRNRKVKTAKTEMNPVVKLYKANLSKLNKNVEKSQSFDADGDSEKLESNAKKESLRSLDKIQTVPGDQKTYDVPLVKADSGEVFNSVDGLDNTEQAKPEVKTSENKNEHEGETASTTNNDAKKSNKLLHSIMSANVSRAGDLENGMMKHAPAKEVTFILPHSDDEEEKKIKYNRYIESPPTLSVKSVESLDEQTAQAAPTSSINAKSSSDGATFIMNDEVDESSEEQVRSGPADVTSYNITLYEDIVNNVEEDFNYRKEKKIPEWASNVKNLEIGLMAQAYAAEYGILEQIFPRSKPVKLYPGF